MTKLVLRPERKYNVIADITREYNIARNSLVKVHSRDISRLETIRASQLPFCPLNFVLTVAKFGPHSVLQFYSSYFTKVGTTVHEVLQDAMATRGRFLANWECSVCGSVRKFSHEPMCCGFQSSYNEIKIEHEYVTGHIDGVFKGEDGRYWILDYKTTSTAQAKNRMAYPGRGYIEQVEAYALACRELFNLDIAGVIVFFITRDNPTQPYVWAQELESEDFPDIKARMKEYHDMHKFALEAKTKEDLKEVWRNRMCRNSQDVDDLAGYCLFKRGCSDKDPTEAIAHFRLGIQNKYIPIREMIDREKVLALKWKARKGSK